MHNPISQFFPSSSSKADPEVASTRGRPRMRRPSTDGWPPPSPPPSSIVDHHYARPSRINWLPCNSGSSSKSLHAPRRPTTVYAHAHPLGRSVSSPVLPSWPAAGSRIYRHASVSSNRSLQLDMAFDDRPTESNDSLTLLHLKPLSPIIEQAQLVGDRRDRRVSPVNLSPLTPGTPASFDHGDHASTYSAFLKRPLKRSISQASSSSLRTVGTGPAPTLPPLDLRPPFVASHRAGPQLFSTVYEDAASERTGSFVTARTDAASDHSPELNSDPDPDVEAQLNDPDANGVEPQPTDPNATSVEPQAIDPEATFVESLPSVSPSPPQLRQRQERERSPPSVSSSFLSRRWRKGLSFGSTRPSFSLLLPSKIELPPLPALLFWVGFAAPWCWLIGGWLVDEGRGIDGEGKGPILPFFMVHKVPGKDKSTFGEGDGKGKGKQIEERKLLEGEDVPQETKMESDAPERQDTTKVVGTRWWSRLNPFSHCTLDADELDSGDEKMVVRTRRGGEAWVVRCRIAAAVSGVVLVVAFVVALIVVGHGH